MEIKEIKIKDIWEDFLLGCGEKTFLNSWNWGEFNKMMGNKIWRLGIFENNNLISLALIIKITAKRGTFLFLPHGPNIKKQGINDKKQILKILLDELKKIAKEEGASFIRISPIWERNNENLRMFQGLGFRNAPMHMHPELTWELDITLPEEELLMRMRKTTRYLIRQAQKNKDIEVIQSQKVEDIKKFNDLYRETVDRQQFAPFSLNFLKNEFSAFNKDAEITIFLGKYKKEIISSGIFIFWQGIGFYHQGASSLKYPKIPVSYLLQWEAIREAKRRGCKKYNFWGIAPLTSDFKLQKPNHPWAGLTLFKIGFGGYEKDYVNTQDLPISFKYWLTYIFETVRKQKRGF